MNREVDSSETSATRVAATPRFAIGLRSRGGGSRGTKVICSSFATHQLQCSADGPETLAKRALALFYPRSYDNYNR